MGTETFLTGITETPIKTFDPEQFINQAEIFCKKEADALAKEREILKAAEKKLQYETDNFENLTERKKKLTRAATENLTDDKRSYAKDKSSLRKIQNEIDACAEGIELLKNTVLPKLNNDIVTAKVSLADKIEQYCKTRLPTVATNIRILHCEANVLLAEAFILGKAFRVCCQKIFDGFDVTPGMTFDIVLPTHGRQSGGEGEQHVLAKPEPTTRVIQINAEGKRYFCSTPEEQQIFTENNPDVKTESFNLELPISTADKYLNDPENKKQFIKR